MRVGRFKLSAEMCARLSDLSNSGSRLDTGVCIEHKSFMALKKKGLVHTNDNHKKYSLYKWQLTNKGKSVANSLK